MLQGVWPLLNIVNVCKTFSPDLLTWYNKLSFLPEKQSSLFPRLKKMFNVCIPNVRKERYTDIIWKVFQHFWQFKLIDHILQTIYFFNFCVSRYSCKNVYVLLLCLLFTMPQCRKCCRVSWKLPSQKVERKRKLKVVCWSNND